MRILGLLFLALILSIPAQAAHHRQHDGVIYKGTPGAGQTTVAQAKALPDDTYVTLTGKLVSRVDDEIYIFRDKSGEIRVDIDEKHFNGLEVGPQDTVRITGEIDRDFGKSVEIDVKHMVILGK